jgi:hypothetical protein
MTRYFVGVNHVATTAGSSIARADPWNSLALAVGYITLYLLLDWASYVEPVRHTGVTAWNPNTGVLMALLMMSVSLAQTSSASPSLAGTKWSPSVTGSLLDQWLH